MERKVYNIKPSSGEALLSFNGRLAADNIYMKVYELDEKKTEKVNYCDNKIDGEVFEADCLSVCAYLKDNKKEVDFVYIDPPFATNINYTKKIFLRNKDGKKILIDKKQEEGIDKQLMYNSIWKKEDYLNWMYTRLVAIREIMSERAAIMVHLDGNIGHYVKILLDEVFGEENFINEIIWSYRSGGGGGRRDAMFTQNLVKKHDSIYFYSKNSGFLVNQLLEKNPAEQSDDTILRDVIDGTIKIKEEDGTYTSYNIQKEDNVTILIKELLKRYCQEDAKDTFLRDILEGKITIKEEDGSYTSYNMQKPNERYYPDEFLDFEHQRPKDLLKLLIRIATQEDFVVADFFGGSGTTALAAYELNRKFIIGDIESNSIQITRDELKKKGASFNVYKINDGINLFKDPVQTKKSIIELNSGELRNESSEYSEFWDGKVFYNNKMLITKILNNDEILTYDYIEFLLNQMINDISNNKECILIYFYKDSELTNAKIRKIIQEKNLDFNINILSIEEMTQNISNEVYEEDSAYLSLEKKNNNDYKLIIEKYFSQYLDKKIKGESNNDIEIKYNGLEYIECISIDTTMKEYWTSNIEDKASKYEFIKGEYALDTDTFRVKIRNIAGREIIINSKEVEKKYEQ